MSYAVTRRTHELGLRVALGASRGGVLRLIVREGMVLTVAGMAFGLAVALALTRLMAALLYGVRPADPWNLVAVISRSQVRPNDRLAIRVRRSSDSNGAGGPHQIS
jgi:ABC-type antimicrobial peptide transport system permease subunit